MAKNIDALDSPQRAMLLSLNPTPCSTRLAEPHPTKTSPLAHHVFSSETASNQRATPVNTSYGPTEAPVTPSSRSSSTEHILHGATSAAHVVAGDFKKRARHLNVQQLSGATPNAADSHQAANTNLFIRNLPSEVTQEQLDGLFAPFGTILSSAIMRNIHTGESLGTAFVRFETHKQAVAAMKSLASTRLGDRVLSLQWARKHEGAPVGEARKKIMKLFVRNIPLCLNVAELTELFAQYGPVRHVTIHRDTAVVSDRKLERHIAFVIYTEEGAAEKAAAAVHNTKPFPSCNNIPIMVKLAEDNYNKHSRKHGSSSSHTSAECSAAQSPYHRTQDKTVPRRASNKWSSAATLPAEAAKSSDRLTHFAAETPQRGPHGMHHGMPSVATWQAPQPSMLPADLTMPRGARQRWMPSPQTSSPCAGVQNYRHNPYSFTTSVSC